MHVLLGPKGEAIFVGGQVWRSRSVVLHNFFIRVHLTIAMLFSLIQIFWECMEQEIRQLLAWFLPFISPIVGTILSLLITLSVSCQISHQRASCMFHY